MTQGLGCIKFLWCVAGIFAVTNDVFYHPEGVYIVLDPSRLWIPTQGFNQSR